MQDEEETILLV